MSTDALSDDVRAALIRVGLDPSAVVSVIGRALEEDLADGPDVTTAATIGADQQGRADAVPRQAGVVAGLPVAAAVSRSSARGECRCRC